MERTSGVPYSSTPPRVDASTRRKRTGNLIPTSDQSRLAHEHLPKVDSERFGVKLPDGRTDLTTIPGDLPPREFSRDLTAMIPKLRSYARSLTWDRDAAEDLVQDTMLKAWKAREQYAHGSSLRAWTFTILRNAFLTQRRRPRFEVGYDEKVAESRLSCPEAQSLTVELADVRRAIEELNSEQRTALQLAMEGVSYEEGARRLGIPLGSFRSRVSRGRRRLQSIINGDAPRKPLPSMIRQPDVHRRSDRRGVWSTAKAAGQRLWIG